MINLSQKTVDTIAQSVRNDFKSLGGERKAEAIIALQELTTKCYGSPFQLVIDELAAPKEEHEEAKISEEVPEGDVMLKEGEPGGPNEDAIKWFAEDSERLKNAGIVIDKSMIDIDGGGDDSSAEIPNTDLPPGDSKKPLWMLKKEEDDKLAQELKDRRKRAITDIPAEQETEHDLGGEQK